MTQARRNAWHSHLPRWILGHPEFDRLKQQHAATLQAVADGCREEGGNLVGCYGGQRLQDRARVSARTLNRHLTKLIELGFVVPTFIATKRAMQMGRRTLCNIYGIPAKPGALESKRAHKQVRVYARRPDGASVPQHLDDPGQQAEMFLASKAPGHMTQGAAQGTAAAGLQHDSDASSSPQKCPTPPVKLSYPPGQLGRPNHTSVHTHGYINHGAGGVSKSGGRGSGKPRCPHVTTADLRDTAALVALHAECERLRVGGTDGEAGLLWVLGAAERALEVGKKPAAMFAAMINRHLWINVTQAQEERARVRLAEHRHEPVFSEPPKSRRGDYAPRAQARPAAARELGPDARAACSALKLAKGDAEAAFRLLQGRGERTGDAWSRSRWETAATEAGIRSQ